MRVNKTVQLEAQVTASRVLKSARTTTTTLLIENEHLPPAVGTRIYIHISSQGVCNGVIVKARGHLAELRTGTKVGEKNGKTKTKQQNCGTLLRFTVSFLGTSPCGDQHENTEMRKDGLSGDITENCSNRSCASSDVRLIVHIHLCFW